MTMANMQNPAVRNLSFAQGYSVRDVSGLLGLSPTQIRGFVRSGLLAPARGQRREFRFTFQDVLLLKTAKGLLDAHVPQRRARRALRKLRTALHGERSLTAVRIEASGSNVVVREDDRVWDAETGQGHFVFAARELIGEVSSLIEPGHLFDDLDPEMTSDEWYNLGLDLEEISPIDALQAYVRAVNLDATNADAHVNRGRLEQMRGELDAAVDAYRQALACAPAHELAHYNLGTVHDERGDSADAMACYRLAPSVADAHYNLARLYEIAGDEFSALRHLRRSRQIELERGRP